MFQQVTNEKDIRSAWAALQRAIAVGATRIKKTAGARGGSEVSNLYVREKLGIWMIPQATMDDGSLFCAFGVLPFKPVGNENMIVLFNATLDFRGRQKAALLARDSDGTSWICHTGGVAGGRLGIGKTAFLASIDREPTEALDFKGRSIAVLPIAQIGSPDMLAQVAEFVHEVAAFKSNRSPPPRAMRSGPFGGSEDEFEGSSKVAARSGYLMTRTHGQVRNRLKDLLVDAGLRVSRDKQRDVVVGSPNRPDIEFEIKPSADSQSVYTAIGQLLMHSAVAPAKRRVAVLPERVPPSHARAIRSLGVSIVTFRIHGNQLTFSGLQAIVPDAKSHIALRPKRT